VTEVVGVIACGEVSFGSRVVRGRVRSYANALVAGECGFPSGFAGVDDALRRLATHRDGSTDLGAVLTFSSRGATSARVECLGNIEALVSAFAREDTRELGSRSEVLSDGLLVRRGTDDGAGDFIRARAERLGSSDLALLGAGTLRSSRLDTNTTRECVTAGAASKLTLAGRADTGSSARKELTDVSEGTAVVDIASEVDGRASAVL